MAIAYLLFSSVFGISVLFLELYSAEVMTQTVAKVLMIMYIVIFLFKDLLMAYILQVHIFFYNLVVIC